MAGGVLRTLKSAVDGSLAHIGVRIVRIANHDRNDFANFIPFNQTMEAAGKRGLSVGDYVDGVLNGVPGSSQSTIDKMASLGVFSEPLRTIVEIGPGTGRYLEKTIKRAQPSRYEIYETARPWAEFLVRTYDVILQPTDGFTLASTADSSVDMVHAHKVFSGASLVVTCSYLHEMARVIRPGGWAVFDAVTERCLSDEAIEIWGSSRIRNGSYPAAIPRDVTESFFSHHGFRLVGSFVVPMPPGTTELLVFRNSPQGFSQSAVH